MSNKYQLREQDAWNIISSLVFLVLLAAASYWLYIAKDIPYQISVFDFVLLILATFRMIRLFMYDTVTDFIRNYFSMFEKGPGKTIHNLLDCPWCTGMWMAFVVSFLFFASTVFWYLIFILALAGAGSIIQKIMLKV